MPQHAIVIGGGLAGLSASCALAQHGWSVTLLESRNRLGGRAGSFVDAASGQLLDTCQHVSMGCCTNFEHFCRSVGVEDLVVPQPTLYFLTPDRRMSRFSADRLPAPLHLARSFWRGHYLSLSDKLRIAWGLLRLRMQPSSADGPFLDWLVRHQQTPRAIANFWGLVLVSALNEEPERIGLRYARKVFVDGFLKHRRGFEVQLPSVPLGRLYGTELQTHLAKLNIELRLNHAVRAIEANGQRVDAIRLRDDTTLNADAYVFALPFDRLLDVLPSNWVLGHRCLSVLKQLEVSPITSVHLWYDRPITALPHAVFVGCVGQWLFNRGETMPGEHYVQVVVSAARAFRGLTHEEIQTRIVAELATLFADAMPERLLRGRVVTEHAATFSAVPGVDQYRPTQATPIANLFLAGDWTATGWPATMEGAVRSGYLAAEAILGPAHKIVQPDL